MGAPVKAPDFYSWCGKLRILYEHPGNVYIGTLLLAIAVAALVGSVKRLVTAYRHADDYTCSLWFIRGLRCLLIAATTGSWSASFFFNQRWLFIIGLIILCQEMYEGAVISSALRDGAKIEKGGKLFP